ncbi:uncharacterized protein BXZ73DRAFT_76998 [Epithele typhae]|uniref:uncharacterized protein n=1 Tax=Epithele typhae TaxID=378194 RepID=UPI00200782CF|nr:uncharacterized protein BXZ73DRAFT_76998 [Epithele typhae]KAH9934515.1 hypothetical protein BXZ73DRAFT_76998 [Epithele typhae]
MSFFMQAVPFSSFGLTFQVLSDFLRSAMFAQILSTPKRAQPFRIPLFALFLSVFLVADVHATIFIGTPSSSVQCGTTHITWSGGAPLYQLSFSGSNGASDSIADVNATDADWKTTMPAGTVVTLTIHDDHLQGTAQWTVADGSDSSCLGGVGTATDTVSATATGTSSSSSTSSSDPASSTDTSLPTMSTSSEESTSTGTTSESSTETPTSTTTSHTITSTSTSVTTSTSSSVVGTDTSGEHTTPSDPLETSYNHHLVNRLIDHVFGEFLDYHDYQECYHYFFDHHEFSLGSYFGDDVSASTYQRGRHFVYQFQHGFHQNWRRQSNQDQCIWNDLTNLRCQPSWPDGFLESDLWRGSDWDGFWQSPVCTQFGCSEGGARMHADDVMMSEKAPPAEHDRLSVNSASYYTSSVSDRPLIAHGSSASLDFLATIRRLTSAFSTTPPHRVYRTGAARDAENGGGDASSFGSSSLRLVHSPESFYSGPDLDASADALASPMPLLQHTRALRPSTTSTTVGASVMLQSPTTPGTDDPFAAFVARQFGPAFDTLDPTDDRSLSVASAAFDHPFVGRASAAPASTLAMRPRATGFWSAGDDDGERSRASGASFPDSTGRASTKYSVDGGVRLAGGRPGSQEADVVPYGYDDGGASTVKTMPPPYGRVLSVADSLPPPVPSLPSPEEGESAGSSVWAR